MSKDMVWNVYREDFNRREIYVFNVFDHGSFREDVLELLKQDMSYDGFSEELKHIAAYYFWAKCEHEVVITAWPPYVTKEEVERLTSEYNKREWFKYGVDLEVSKKVDIYQQLRLNWDAFVDYTFGFSK